MLISILWSDDIVVNEKPGEIYALTFVVNESGGLFLHPSIFSIKHSRRA